VVVVWGAVGLVVGGVLNVLISRLPYWGGPLTAPLRCHTCGHQLSWVEVLPIAGYALQRGSCRYCGKSISSRFPLVEVASALLFVLAYLRFGPGTQLVVSSFFIAVLILVFVIDMRHRLILNVVTYPVAVIALVLSAVMPGASLVSSLAGAALYGGFFMVMFLLAVLIYRRGDALGLGDVKLAVVIGLMTGFQLTVVALLAGVFLGGVSAVFALIRGRSNKDVMPYGTALSVGAILTILYGQQIMAWYLRT
jgi:leader peptidase (prepilin peptidase) / N-methyltransferase